MMPLPYTSAALREAAPGFALNLIVTREVGWFVLRERRSETGAWRIAHSSPTAQGILDFLVLEWPVGTRVQWRIEPRREGMWVRFVRGLVALFDEKQTPNVERRTSNVERES